MQINLTDKTKRQMIASFVNGTLKSKDISIVEQIVGNDPVYQSFYQRKVQEREFILEMIPDAKLKLDEKATLLKDIAGVNSDLLVEDIIPWKERVKEFLDKPVFTIKF